MARILQNQGAKYNNWGVMTGSSHRYIKLFSLLVVGGALGAGFAVPGAQAQSGKPMMLASADAAGKRFMNLNGARSGMRPAALRSDNDAIRSGYMRIDRDMMIVNMRKPRSNVIVTRPQSGEEAAIAPGSEGNDAAAIFGSGSRQPQARVSGHAWPVARNAKQYISSGYGMRKDPFHGKQRFHGGIDIAADPGTPVLASADGVVSAIGAKGGFGNHVSVTHRDGSISMYGHLRSETVRVGQRVRQGQQVGQVGSTGRSTGPHLDYRVKQNGQTIDPMRVLARSSMPNMSRDVASSAGTKASVAAVDGKGARRLPGRPMVIRVQ